MIRGMAVSLTRPRPRHAPPNNLPLKGCKKFMSGRYDIAPVGVGASPGIVLLTDADGGAKRRLLAQVTEIFFETSNTKMFESAAAKDLFFKRWCGSYAKMAPDAFLLATDRGEAVGYVAGCVDSFSPAYQAIADGIFYYTPPARLALSSYPSHFHINIRPDYQGKGLGRLLTERFVNLCRDSGYPSVHVVTGASSAAEKFYKACCFKRLAPMAEFSNDLAVLTRSTLVP